jgi:hypothetical protein
MIDGFSQDQNSQPTSPFKSKKVFKLQNSIILFIKKEIAAVAEVLGDTLRKTVSIVVIKPQDVGSCYWRHAYTT